MAFNTFAGQTSPSLTQLDANFAKCPELVSGVAFATASPAVTAAALELATMATLRKVGSSANGAVWRPFAVTLSITDIGTVNACATSGGAFTVTLPSAATLPAGGRLDFFVAGSNPLTLARAGTDTIVADVVTGLTSIVLYPGQCGTLYRASSTEWYYFGDMRRYESAWTATLPAGSAVVNYTHGLGVTPRLAWMEAECTTTSNGWAVGDRVELLAHLTAYDHRPTIGKSSTTLTLLAGGGSPGWAVAPKTGGAPTSVTATSWKYRVVAVA